ncbi:regulatory protein RecX [Rickettsiella grylli]|uniref:Regulatory protein RecX n=1 Tax=Rickettsiella grylli TaxID=59196 RepID=A8PQD8_9COXI|nr:regulatory protein RecX [Rickettsiella grylli]EDP45830.1 regulatory protein RecX [Rickettsiella grylli]
MLSEKNASEIDKNIYHIALRYLAQKEHSRCTLRKKLIQKGFLQQSINVVLDNLSQQKLLDDVRFCESFIQKRIRQGYGPLRIIAECHQYGIADTIILDQLPQDETFWVAIIQKILKKKSKSNDFLKSPLRQIRYLQHRGFKLDQIKVSQKI